MKRLSELHCVIEAYKEHSCDDRYSKAMYMSLLACYENCYNNIFTAIKKWLQEEMWIKNVDEIYWKELYRIAAKHGIIQNVKDWWNFHMASKKWLDAFEEGVCEYMVITSSMFYYEVSGLLRQEAFWI
jgi:hypothetical protein